MKNSPIDFLEKAILGHKELRVFDITKRILIVLIPWTIISTFAIMLFDSYGFKDAAVLVAIVYPIGLWIVNLATKKRLLKTKSPQENSEE